MANIDKKNVRYNIMIILVYIIGIILIVQLFNLQIIHGNEYLETSSTRLTRETTIGAARGNILDKNGNIIAGSSIKYTLEIYRSKIDDKTLNSTILNVINVLETNGDKYIDKFPIDINTMTFTMENEELQKWLVSSDLNENAKIEEVIDKYKEKYKIESDNIKDIRKIIAVRYGIEKSGYSAMKSYIIADSINTQSVAIFEEKNLSYPGISIKTSPTRNYYKVSLASHILGYIGQINQEELDLNSGYDINDYIGKSGIEYVFERYLRGTNGAKQTDMSIDGTTTGQYITKEAIAGSNVILTIDANIQAVAETALKNNIEKIKNGGFGKSYDAKAGSVVVMNVKTGEILAMASFPDFEPRLFINGISTQKWNEYTKEGRSALINRAIQSAYAPGSLFKMVSAIAGLETGAITTDEKITDLGVYPKGHNPVCWIWSGYHRTHGSLNVSDAIKNSCNYFFYEVGSRMGIENLENYASYFGLGQKTNIELPGEAAGTLAGKKLYERLEKTWYYGNTLSAVIGQAENSFSPLQITKYISMLVNGGENIDVTIIKDIINADGTKVGKDEIKRYVSEKLGITYDKKENLDLEDKNVKAVLEGMRSVTTETGGTAYSIFKNFNIEVGGKTGSAEAGENINAWFGGFAPYDNPEIAVVVSVENGGHGYYTAEVAKEILEAYFGLNEEITENINATPYL